MEDVICITTKSQIPDALNGYFKRSGFNLKTFLLPSVDTAQINNSKYLLLISPFLINGIYVSAENIWKKYLYLEFPNTRLISVGFKKAEAKNHLDLLQRPKELKTFLQEAKKVSEDWSPIDTGGLNMQEKLNRFFEGHGKESVTDELEKILRILTIAKDEINEFQVDYETVKKELILENRVPQKWQYLNNRWYSYKPYFKCLPFFPILEQIDHIFEQILPFFEQNCENENLFWEFDCVGKLKIIKDLLTPIGNQYVW